MKHHFESVTNYTGSGQKSMPGFSKQHVGTANNMVINCGAEFSVVTFV